LWFGSIDVFVLLVTNGDVCTNACTLGEYEDVKWKVRRLQQNNVIVSGAGLKYSSSSLTHFVVKFEAWAAIHSGL
jgi:hypothetical protein